MYELLEILSAWVRQRGGKNFVGFLLFVVLPILTATYIAGKQLIY